MGKKEGLQAQQDTGKAVTSPFYTYLCWWPPAVTYMFIMNLAH